MFDQPQKTQGTKPAGTSPLPQGRPQEPSTQPNPIQERPVSPVQPARPVPLSQNAPVPPQVQVPRHPREPEDIFTRTDPALSQAQTSPPLRTAQIDRSIPRPDILKPKTPPYTKAQSPPSNLPTQTSVQKRVDDMLESSSLPIPKQPPPPPKGPELPRMPGIAEHQPPLLKRRIFIIIIISLVALAVLGFAGFFIYKKYFSVSEIIDEEVFETPESEDLEADTDPDAVGTIPPAPTSQETPDLTPSPLPTPELDSDLDGLTDAEESTYKTNPYSIDSDSDKLTDKDEIEVFKTNPLNPDSDGDTYPDGHEVENGYNPLGPGKLEGAG